MGKEKRKRITWNFDKVKHFVEIESGSGIKLLSDAFINSHEKLRFECICGKEFQRKFAKFYHNNQYTCSECSFRKMGEARRKSHEQYVQDVANLHGNEYTVIGQYVRSTDKILIRHNSPMCNYREFEVDADSILQGKGCLTCHYITRRGSSNPTWNPDLTDEERIANRDYFEYRVWRDAVYARDDYTCQCCNVRGTKLNAHHILNFSKYQELRTSVDNGITLCKECHQSFHKKYGYKDNNRSQLENFLIQHSTIKELA